MSAGAGAIGPLGLSRVPTHQLESVASGIERQSLRFPLTAARLRAAGVGALVEHLPLFEGLSPVQTLALVHCVLAERALHAGPALELVWTGPDVPETVVRDTALVLRDLFASATSSVLVGGCYFSGGEHILAPLYEAIKDRGVRATFCLNIPAPAPDAVQRAPPGMGHCEDRYDIVVDEEHDGVWEPTSQSPADTGSAAHLGKPHRLVGDARQARPDLGHEPRTQSGAAGLVPARGLADLPLSGAVEAELAAHFFSSASSSSRTSEGSPTLSPRRTLSARRLISASHSSSLTSSGGPSTLSSSFRSDSNPLGLGETEGLRHESACRRFAWLAGFARHPKEDAPAHRGPQGEGRPEPASPHCCTCATPPAVVPALPQSSAHLPPSDSELKILVSAVQFRPRTPNFRAECRFRSFGGVWFGSESVGRSTLPECFVARRARTVSCIREQPSCPGSEPMQLVSSLGVTVMERRLRARGIGCSLGEQHAR